MPGASPILSLSLLAATGADFHAPSPAFASQLSYIRMSNPMRSTLCNHVQCFDAASWFQINEQTPTWTCPVCEQALKVEHLFIDE